MDIVSKLWSFCHILRHDGVDSSDYVEQLTYLLFLKMADENDIVIPEGCRWVDLIAKSQEDKTGEALKTTYELALQTLQIQDGILGKIFQEPISKIRNAVSLKKIIDGIESVGWTKLGKDVQGEAFEGLLEKTASEGKKGAGQFFTPRPLIQAIVNVMQPNPLKDKVIGDVAMGTGGFITEAMEWAKKNIDVKKWELVKEKSYYGQELVVRPYRLALMNLFLHGVNADKTLTLGDSIYTENIKEELYDCILTNPPFGSRGTIGAPKQRNFWVETSNIQINFIQHVYNMLKPQGRAAIVLPDSCLTDDKAKEVWSKLIGEGLCNVHTILRLPKGVFIPYANVNACVVFFQKGVKTENVWIFDGRIDVPDITKSSRPLEYEKHFKDFVTAYGKKNDGTSPRTESVRFEKHSIEEIKEKGFDLFFQKSIEPSPVLSLSPEFLIEEMIADYERKIEALKELKATLLSFKNENQQNTDTNTLDTSTITRVSNKPKREKTSNTKKTTI